MTTRESVVDKWKALPWKRFQKTVFRLQKRIYKAQKAGNSRLVRMLQKLLLRSQAAKFLAIRQVTQLNQGRKTAGIDGISSLEPNERYDLGLKLNIKNWRHAKLRRIWIPKSNGDKRPLGIPNMEDRALQCLLKYALEPSCEAYFNAHSYGFRPGRGCHDIQRLLYNNLNSNGNGIQKRILEMDIEKCFDRIDHSYLMSQIDLPRVAKQGLFRAIKAGVLKERPISIMGTPQGGVISPLLANIALHGLENVGEKLRFKVVNGQGNIDTIRGIRYADDCVFILKPGDDDEKLRALVDEFLAKRGLNVSEAKTKLVNSTEGFEFLGWHFKVKPDGRFLSTPSDKNHESIKKEIKQTLKDTKYKLEDRIARVAQKVRGWRNYHKFCDMSKHDLWHINHWTWKFIRKQGSYNRATTANIVKIMFPPIPWKVNDHIQVKGDKSPFDGDWLYWSKRVSKQYDGATSKVLKLQSYKCNHCQLAFHPEDKVELHHIDGNHQNWKPKNLEVLHRHCHQYMPVHGLVRRKATGE